MYVNFVLLLSKLVIMLFILNAEVVGNEME